MADVDRLFDELAAAYVRGERPDLPAYLARAGDEADELARLVDAFLRTVPPPEPSEDEKAAERYMTPAYKKKYADTFNRLVKPNATKLKAKVEAEVKASGVAHADADRVNVLLYVNQTTRSTANSGEPQVALNRVQLSMVKQGGTWLVNDITSY